MAAVRKPRKPSALRDPRTRAIAAMLRVAHDQGWQRATLAAIAAEAGLGLDELQSLFASRAAMVAAFLADVDRDMLQRAGTADGDSARDRLFAVVMARLDALKPHRGAALAILRGALLDPVTGVALACALRRSLAWMLAAAGMPHGGVEGELRLQCLGAIYASTLWAWARDESEDLAATMAHLDRQLRRAQRVFEWLRSVAAIRAKTSRKPARA
jgi:AcrR family transcriptional regulator